MNVTQITMDKESAERKFEEYSRITKKEKKYLKQLQESYSFLKQGKKLIDIYEVFHKCGIKNALPKFAIGRADRKQTIFIKRRKGAGGFGHTGGRWNQYSGDVTLPKGTFRYKDMKNTYYKTKVPIVPARFLPEKLKDYWVLWEVENWEKMDVPPSDPILLKRISKNLFVILAVWDLTPLEKALVRGR